jgi:hypothetical protein
MVALSDAERAARYREKRRAGAAPVHYRRPVDRRTRPQKWHDAVETLAALLDDYEQWRDNLPPSLAESSTAARIEEVLELRELVDQLQAAELPKGFGRDG